MFSEENAQSQTDEQMEFSTGFDINIEDLHFDFNNDVFQDAQQTVEIVQETSETEGKNVLMPTDQIVQYTNQDVQGNASNELILSQGGQLSADPIKVRKTQEGGGGGIMFAFSSFSPTEVTDQKQIEFSF